MKAIYSYAYLRLSDEEFKRGESSSIRNQRTAIQQYCQHHGITILREFVDDGYSGGSFDRPGFNRMLQFLPRGEVTMVLTKDLSRLGRDMREASYYAETFFPDHGVHYIAIHDNFDSELDNTLAPFQFAMNDVYLRDTSKKVKTILNSKKQAGQYAACPPFGYQKNPRDKNQLIPDENTAPIVRRIFALAGEGNSTRAICDRLNQLGLITPLKYRVLYRDDFGEEGAARATDRWNYVTVKRILRNEVYLGHTLLGRSKKLNLKSQKTVALDRSDWIIVPDTHQPLVSREAFDLAQQHMKSAASEWQQHDRVRRSIFGKVAYCAHCGAAMCSAGSVYKGEREKYWYLQCNNLPRRSAHPCEHPARIRYRDLVEIVTNELNHFIALSDEQIDALIRSVAQSSDVSQRKNQYREELRTLTARQTQIDHTVLTLYRDSVSGKLSQDRLDRMVRTLEEESTQNQDAISQLQARLSAVGDASANYSRFFDLVRQATHITTLTPQLINTFIERIEISQRVLPEGAKAAGPKTPYSQDIRIFYRFIGEITESPARGITRAG